MILNKKKHKKKLREPILPDPTQPSSYTHHMVLYQLKIQVFQTGLNSSFQFLYIFSLPASLINKCFEVAPKVFYRAGLGDICWIDVFRYYRDSFSFQAVQDGASVMGAGQVGQEYVTTLSIILSCQQSLFDCAPYDDQSIVSIFEWCLWLRFQLDDRDEPSDRLFYFVEQTQPNVKPTVENNQSQQSCPQS